MPFADTNGIQTYYETAGAASNPTIALVHGHSLDLRSWDHQVGALVDAGFRVVRHDVRGHGRSEAPPVGYTWDNYSAELAGLFDHLGIRTAHVAGLSMGGGVALKFALDYPGRTRSLTLVDTALPGFSYSPEFSERILALQEAVRAEGVKAAFERLWFNDPLFDHLRRFPERMREAREMCLGYSAVEYREDSHTPGYVQPDLIARLADVRVPTLVAVGEEDIPDFRLISEIAASTIPAARLQVMPGCGHLPNMEDPDSFNRILIGFLRDNA
jgi:pimeloyl-ACP methyl ester carboxylesterase